MSTCSGQHHAVVPRIPDEDCVMDRKAQIIALDDTDSLRALEPKRIRGFYVFFLPLLFSLISCGAGGWFIYDADDIPVVGLVLVAVGIVLAVGYVIFETLF